MRRDQPAVADRGDRVVGRRPGEGPIGNRGPARSDRAGDELDTLTDGYGQVLFDTADFQGVQPGTYATTIAFAGNDRYLPSSLSLTQTVTPGPDHSLALNGVRGFAEAPGTPDLNMTGDWTVEVWFKDEDPNGFKHRDREIVSKGKPGLNSGQAAEFRYLLSQTENPGEDDDGGFEL